MSEIQNETETNLNNDTPQAGPVERVSWGPKLFYGVLIAVLVFFWWMVIYPHGVVSTH